MLADPADQQHLLTLAELDSEIGRLQHTAKTLPQHARIAELMTTRQAITDAPRTWSSRFTGRNPT